MDRGEVPGIVYEFIEFLDEIGVDGMARAGKSEVGRFARRLIASGRNGLENFEALRDYADERGHRAMYTATVELMDCGNALSVLADTVEERYGAAARLRIFQEALPPLGADEKERCEYTKTIGERMTRHLSPEESRAAWFQVQHGIPPESWHRGDMEDREKFARCGNVDAFLNLKRRERDASLRRLRDEDKPWYTIVIDDEVLEFIRSDPEMEVGRREGDKIFITKVPYNASRYLHADDGKLKRYYACHCPLVREAILQDMPVPRDICNCSLGHASHYLAGLGLPLQGEVLESAVGGDFRCRFVFTLPPASIAGRENDHAAEPK